MFALRKVSGLSLHNAAGATQHITGFVLVGHLAIDSTADRQRASYVLYVRDLMKGPMLHMLGMPAEHDFLCPRVLLPRRPLGSRCGKWVPSHQASPCQWLRLHAKQKRRLHGPRQSRRRRGSGKGCQAVCGRQFTR